MYALGLETLPQGPGTLSFLENILYERGQLSMFVGRLLHLSYSTSMAYEAADDIRFVELRITFSPKEGTVALGSDTDLDT